MTALLMMHKRMTAPAQGLQVGERVVTLVSRGCDAQPVDVVDVQIVRAAAFLASAVIALKSFPAIAAETVVILRDFAPLRHLFRIGFKPVVGFRSPKFLRAFGAPSLRPVAKCEVGSTIRALESRAKGCYAVLAAKTSEMRDVVLAAILRPARLANLLRRACRCEIGAANNAGFGFVVGHWEAPLVAFPTYYRRA